MYIPGYHNLYDNNGVRIEESCIRRGVDNNEYVLSGPKTIELPRPKNVISGVSFYCSWIFNHWGHLLTESVSRLWPILSDSWTPPDQFIFTNPYSLIKSAQILDFMHTVNITVDTTRFYPTETLFTD